MGNVSYNQPRTFRIGWIFLLLAGTALWSIVFVIYKLLLRTGFLGLEKRNMKK